ncbi:hypothetical protein B0H19DRAFT_721931 [Mycena capillaripes]|nr:hypothetical protein B0H19DRAFT_721931 [Mycena capillaripes]
MDDAWQSQDIEVAPSAISIPTSADAPPSVDTWAHDGTDADADRDSGRDHRGGGRDADRDDSRGGDRGGRGRRGGGRGGGRGRSRSRSPRRDGEKGNNPGNNLHVSGLSHKIDTRELEEAFGKMGRVKKASVMYDPHTRESRGFGFVTMETPEEADAAVAALNGSELGGKAIHVEKACISYHLCPSSLFTHMLTNHGTPGPPRARTHADAGEVSRAAEEGG